MKALIVVPALVLAASLGFLVASCASNGDATSAGPVPSLDGTTDGTSEEIPTTTAEETTTTTDSGTPTEPPSSQVTYQVWFRNTDGLFVTYRAEPATSRVGTAALESLLGGPDSFEQGYGLRTAIPGDTQLLGLEIDRESRTSISRPSSRQATATRHSTCASRRSSTRSRSSRPSRRA